jgi:hypothetical protein
MTPVAAPIPSPFGNPVADHVYTPFPPVAVTVAEYGVFTKAATSVDGEIASAGSTVKRYVWPPVAWLLSVTVAFTVNGLPVVVVGVPVSAPVVALKLIHPGKPVADNV